MSTKILSSERRTSNPHLLLSAVVAVALRVRRLNLFSVALPAGSLRPPCDRTPFGARTDSLLLETPIENAIRRESTWKYLEFVANRPEFLNEYKFHIGQITWPEF